MLFIYFLGKTKSGCLEFLFLFSSAILFSKMGSLFFSLLIVFWVFESTSQLFFNFISLFSVMKDNFFLLFSIKYYRLWSKGANQCKFLRISSARVKICQIPHVNVEKKSQIPLRHFTSFFILMTHNSFVNFKIMHFLLWITGSHQSPNFETFECSSENLPNYCLFPNHKSVFLQILHHSSVSYKINRLNFFSSNNIYFTQKEPSNVKIFGTLECLRQNFSNSSSQFWNDKSIPLQIFHITPL